MLLSFYTYSQEFYINMGKNYTSYHFKNTPNISSTVSDDIGNSFEIGYLSTKLKDSQELLSYELGVSLNEYNSIVKAPEEAITYYTQYVGLRSALNYIILREQHRNRFTVYLKGGLSADQFLAGKEEIDGKIYDLKNYDEFNKALFMVSLGLHANMIISDDLSFNLGYNRYETLYNTGNTLSQTLRFSIEQIKMGLTFRID
nr:outer membrane beta-barrel protein [uncultured Flavobacterium sp.]